MSSASLPVSNESVRSVPLMGPDTVMASAMCLLLCVADTCQASSQSSTTPVPALIISAPVVVLLGDRGNRWSVRAGTGDRRLAADG